MLRTAAPSRPPPKTPTTLATAMVDSDSLVTSNTIRGLSSQSRLAADKHVDGSSSPLRGDGTCLNLTDWSKFSYAELKEECRRQGLDDSANKTELEKILKMQEMHEAAAHIKQEIKLSSPQQWVHISHKKHPLEFHSELSLETTDCQGVNLEGGCLHSTNGGAKAIDYDPQKVNMGMYFCKVCDFALCPACFNHELPRPKLGKL